MVSSFAGRWVGTDDLTFGHPRIVLSASPGKAAGAIERALRSAGAVVEVVGPVVAARGVVDLEPDLVVVDVGSNDTEASADTSAARGPSDPEGEASQSGLIRALHDASEPASFLPVVALLGDRSMLARDRLLAAGADDVLLKPFDVAELLLRLDNLLAARRSRLEMQARNANLRGQLDDHLREQILERERFHEQLIDLQEQERARIAADIHDDALQSLAAVGMRLQAVARSLGSGPFVPEIDELVLELRSTNEKLRSLVFDLHPTSLDEDGLPVVLHRRAVELARGSDVRVRLIDRHGGSMPTEVALVLFRIGQEAVVNSLRHADGSEVVIDFSVDGHWGVLAIQDDGCGFDLEGALAAAPSGHLGLRVMRERARTLDGSVTISTGPGLGTRVEARVRLDRDEPHPLGAMLLGGLP